MEEAIFSFTLPCQQSCPFKHCHANKLMDYCGIEEGDIIEDVVKMEITARGFFVPEDIAKLILEGAFPGLSLEEFDLKKGMIIGCEGYIVGHKGEFEIILTKYEP